jgi:hypothetical protein
VTLERVRRARIASMTQAPAQLLLYRFGPGAGFEGQLLGALERMESGGSVRVLHALFVMRDADTGETVATDLRGDGAGGFASPLLSFRLEPAARRQATERALASEAGDAVRELAQVLEPGGAMAAVLVAHRWAEALEDAVARTGGTRVDNRFVDATTLRAELLTPAG